MRGVAATHWRRAPTQWRRAPHSCGIIKQASRQDGAGRPHRQRSASSAKGADTPRRPSAWYCAGGSWRTPPGPSASPSSGTLRRRTWQPDTTGLSAWAGLAMLRTLLPTGLLDNLDSNMPPFRNADASPSSEFGRGGNPPSLPQKTTTTSLFFVFVFLFFTFYI